MAYRIYTYFSPSSPSPPHSLFFRSEAFKVKTFQPNYKTNPFERRCFDVSALVFFVCCHSFFYYSFLFDALFFHFKFSDTTIEDFKTKTPLFAGEIRSLSLSLLHSK